MYIGENICILYMYVQKEQQAYTIYKQLLSCESII